MQSEAKATHRRMLNQFAALWVTGMMCVVEQALILNLNDLCIPGEITVTDFREGVSP